MEDRTQLSTKTWRPLMDEFTGLVESACLRRDAYLDKVFAHEARKLKDEIQHPNSPEAREYLQRKLDELERVPLNLALSRGTIDSMNRACEDLNMVRDCFINRILFLLVAPTAQLEVITGIPLMEILGDLLGENQRDFLYQEVWDGSLRSISVIVTEDPFRAWRNVIEYERDQKRDSTPLHSCIIIPELFKNKPSGAWALNCYLPDELIPGSPAAGRAAQSLADLFGDPVPKNPKPPKKGKKAK